MSTPITGSQAIGQEQKTEAPSSYVFFFGNGSAEGNGKMRDILGGKLSSWRDKDGDWLETGLLIFGEFRRLVLVFLDPVESPVGQPELIAINQTQLHVNFVSIHVSIEGQVILCRAPEGDAGFPVLVALLRKRDHLVVEVD